MKIGLSVFLGAFVLSAGFAQTSAQAVTLPSKPHAERVVGHVTFWKEHDKKRAHKVHRAHRAHKHAHWHKHPKKH